MADSNLNGADMVEDDIQIPVGEEMTQDEFHEIVLMRHAYQKLDGLPLGFGLPEYSEDIDNETVKKFFSLDLSDTMREIQVDISMIQEGSLDEMMVENRIVYHALRRFRFTASTFFKFSTATDGKTVDKTMIPKMLKDLIDEYDKEYKEWRSRSSGSIWTRTATLNYTNV